MTLALSVAALALFLAAAFQDVTTRRIPNILVAALAVVGLLRIAAELAAGGGWGAAATDLGLAAAVLAFGAALFHFGLFGGGDVKLLAAGTLFVGLAGAWPFFAGTAAAGGLLALGFVVWIASVGRDAPRPSLPYGVAIAAGGALGVLAGI